MGNEGTCSISKAGSNNRRKVETDSCSERTKRRRSAETLEVASNIHGGGEISLKSSTAGLLYTLNRRCSEDDLVGGIVKCKKETVFPKLYKKAVDEFEHTSENMLRSIAVYHSKGIMGKIMYMSVYRASSNSYSAHKKKSVRMTVANYPIPRLVPYHRLTAYVKSIVVGKLHSVRDTFYDGLEEKNKVSGCYRELEELHLKLAELYLSNDRHELLTFTETNKFHVALGGDEAPFGKDDSAFAWLVSILNIGQGVLSSNENVLLFGPIAVRIVSL
jgi:hypothetical protein